MLTFQLYPNSVTLRLQLLYKINNNSLVHPTLLIETGNTVSRSNVMLHAQKWSLGWLVNCVTWSNTGFKPFINCLVSCHAIAGVYVYGVYVIIGNISTLFLLLFGTFSHCTQKVVNKNKGIFISVITLEP